MAIKQAIIEEQERKEAKQLAKRRQMAKEQKARVLGSLLIHSNYSKSG
jgi:hypothetical protein